MRLNREMTIIKRPFDGENAARARRENECRRRRKNGENHQKIVRELLAQECQQSLPYTTFRTNLSHIIIPRNSRIFREFLPAFRAFLNL